MKKYKRKFLPNMIVMYVGESDSCNTNGHLYRVLGKDARGFRITTDTLLNLVIDAEHKVYEKFTPVKIGKRDKFLLTLSGRLHLDDT